jgi:hypothetical protein
MKKLLMGFVVGAVAGGVFGFYVRPGGPRQSATPAPAVASVTAPEIARRAASGTGTENGEQKPGFSEPASSTATGTAAATMAASQPGPPGQGPARAELQLSGARLDAERVGGESPADKLLGSPNAYCMFDPGAGGQWPKGALLAHTAAWQGGPIEFDSIDVAANHAQMNGAGATGTLDGSIGIRATATNDGLHFSGFNGRGELVAVTVFGALDSAGKYRAVLSMHGSQMDHESAQFYGGCTIR